MTPGKYKLQDVLDDVMLGESQPSHGGLLRWMKRYPEFAKELETFFVAWSKSEMWKHLPDLVEIDDGAITERASKRALANLRCFERTK